MFAAPRGVAVDWQGQIYVADTDNDRLRKLTPDGEVSTLAGSERGFADGARTAAHFHHPNALVVDGTGTAFVVDAGTRRVRKVSPGGTATLSNPATGRGCRPGYPGHGRDMVTEAGMSTARAGCFRPLNRCGGGQT